MLSWRHLVVIGLLGSALLGCRDRAWYGSGLLWELPTVPSASLYTPLDVYRGLYAFADSPLARTEAEMPGAIEGDDALPAGPAAPIVMCARDVDAMPQIITLDEQPALVDFFAYEGLPAALPVSVQDTTLIVATQGDGVRLNCTGELTGVLLRLLCTVTPSTGQVTQCQQVAQKID